MTNNNQRKPKRWELYQMEWQIPDLRTDEPIGVYPRQSTKKQLKNNRQSFEKQTQDSIKYLMKRGWPEELIKVYDQDMGLSGTLGIEDRESLNQLIADIRAGRRRTVYAAEVDRLFRDEDRIDSNVFIKICKEADCLVLTDRAIYDLRIPRHVDYFRDEIERAWKYFESQILIRAHQHLDRARSQGLYDGGPVLMGYIIDRNPNSPTYKKYTPYQPHAQRSLEYFQWLYDCGGVWGIFEKKLNNLPYMYPIEEQWVKDQKAFSTVLKVVYGTELDEEGKPKPIGYNFSRDGLKDYMRNRTLLGDQKYGDEWIENNHQAIIPRDLWEFAQEVIRSMKEKDLHKRHYHTPVPSVIYDLLHAGPGVEQRCVTRRLDKGTYTIVEYKGLRQGIIASIDIDAFEQIFLEKFTERLRETDRFKDYEKHLLEPGKQAEERKTNLKAAIHELSEQIDGLFLTLKSPKLDASQRNDFVEERAKLIRRRDALNRELNIKSPLQTYLKYKDLIHLMGKYWNRYPFEDRQALVALLIRRVPLEYLSPRFLRIIIEWKEFPTDTGIIQRPITCSFRWTPEEDQIIREIYATARPQELLDAFPRRPWEGIRNRAAELKVVRPLSAREKIPYRNISKEDVQIAEQYGIPLEEITTVAETYITRWETPFSMALML
jgi:DNA invertase Pin-like site-specific DNA recombinase